MEDMTPIIHGYREKMEANTMGKTCHSRNTEYQHWEHPVACSVRIQSPDRVHVAGEVEGYLDQGPPSAEHSFPQHKMWADEDWTQPWREEYREVCGVERNPSVTGSELPVQGRACESWTEPQDDTYYA